MARLRIETSPEITVKDESFLLKAAAGATGDLLQIKDSSGNTIVRISQTEGEITKAIGVPTANAGTNTTQIASTAFVNAAVASLIDSAPGTLNTLNELSSALGGDANFATTLSTNLGLKAPLASPTFSGNVAGVSATMVGLGNVDNTSDANKPVSTAGQTALDLKANLASPTFTGNVSGVSKSMVGLDNVDNTPDANKPVSTAGQTALNLKADQTAVDLKAPLASPTFTGTVTVPTPVNNTDAVTKAYVDGEVSGATINTLDEIGDVTITSASAGDFLKWSGTAFVNDQIDLGTDTVGNYVSGLTAGTGITVTHTPSEGSSPTVAVDATIATLNSPTFTGTPTLPTGTIATTQTAGDNSTAVATTAFVGTAVANLVDSAPAALNTLDELAAALGDDVNFSTTVANSIGLKAPLESPTFTGTVTLPSGTVTSAMIADATIVNADISASAAIEMSKIADVVTNQQTVNYLLVLNDKNKIVEMNLAGNNTVGVPLNSSVAWPIGSQINILQVGAGQTTIVAVAGVTVNATPGLKMRAQFSYATLIKRATDTWVLVGDLSA